MEYFERSLLLFCAGLFFLVRESSSSPTTNKPRSESGNKTARSVSCLQYHEVVTGEVPFTIARQYNIKPEQLQFMNPSMDVYDLQAKDKLCIKTNRYPKGTPTSGNSSSPLDGAAGTLDLKTRLCGDFYLSYGDQPGVDLPTPCLNPKVRTDFINYMKENKGLVGSHRSRDAWRVNCANPNYCTLCNRSACPLQKRSTTEV